MQYLGMFAGMLNKLGKIGVIVGFCLGNAILTYVANGNTIAVITIREILIASLGLLLLPKNVNIDIADIVGKDNLLIKTHPRDTRTLYVDNGFNVDENSSVPWEAIQLSGKFDDKVFMTINSGSVLSGSLMSKNKVKTFYMYKMCDYKGNESCQKNVIDIEALLKNSNMKSIFNNVQVAEKIEDIL